VAADNYAGSTSNTSLRAFVDGCCLVNQRPVPPFRTKITKADAATKDAQGVGLYQSAGTVEGKSIFA
jgi:hypothetical protein